MNLLISVIIKGVMVLFSLKGCYSSDGWRVSQWSAPKTEEVRQFNTGVCVELSQLKAASGEPSISSQSNYCPVLEQQLTAFRAKRLNHWNGHSRL